MGTHWNERGREREREREEREREKEGGDRSRWDTEEGRGECLPPRAQAHEGRARTGLERDDVPDDPAAHLYYIRYFSKLLSYHIV